MRPASRRYGMQGRRSRCGKRVLTGEPSARGCAIAAGLLLSIASTAVHAACPIPHAVQVQASIDSGRIAVRTDYSTTDLQRLAGSMSQEPPHPILGFYADEIGYKLQTPIIRADRCGAVLIRVEVVATQRVIEIASDIMGNKCLFSAALQHYRHHAELQATALAKATRLLEPALGNFVADAASSQADVQPSPDAALRAHASGFVDTWLKDFVKGLPALRREADSPEEVEALRQACST